MSIAGIKLYDVLTRHQVYLEGVKVDQARQFNSVLLKLDGDLRVLLSRLKFDTLDAMTKAELRSFLSTIKETQWRVYNAYTDDIIAMLRAFMDVDLNLMTGLYDETADPQLSPAAKQKLSDQATAINNSRLWATIFAAPIPANGVLIRPFINTFTANSVGTVANLVSKGYANAWTPRQLFNEIVGTKSLNYRDGAVNKINNQASAVLSTLFQHVSAVTQASLTDIYYDHYQWVSVIDSGTTDICRSRDGNVYEVDNGPLPPAHIRCRSKTVPVSILDPIADQPKTYYGWITRQPTAVQNDILGQAKASQLRSGAIQAKDMPSFADAKPLTLAAFAAKRDLILTT